MTALSSPADLSLTLPDIIKLGATDSVFYSRQWFPKTVRQESAPFHRKMDEVIEGPGRLKCLQVFRDGAKTTKVRLFLSKRVAYGISRTILVIGKSEGHARRTIKWIRNQVSVNRPWASAFGLSQGRTWNDGECEILRFLNGMEAPERIHIIGMGITGSIRGINMDDWRPDLIILDDVIDEESAGTPEQREKTNKLIYGAIVGSLAPASEEPMAMLLALQTPHNRDDFSVKAEKDPDWEFFRIGVWTEETKNLPIEERISAWEARYPSTEVRAKMLGYMRRNELSIWLREYECVIGSPETCAFIVNWLQRWEVLPKFLTHIMVIDPVPPPSPAALAKGDVKRDFESFAILGGFDGNFYVREVSVNRGHQPNWTVSEFWRLKAKYRPQWLIVEAVGYQAVLAWLLRQTMQQRMDYIPVQEFKDSHSKYFRITDGITGPASEGHLFIPPDGSLEGITYSEGMRQFVQQFTEYPNVSHDDALETVAVGCSFLQGKILPSDEHAFNEEEQLEDNPQYYFRGKSNKRIGEACP